MWILLRTIQGSWLLPIPVSRVLYIWNVLLELMEMECLGGWCCHCSFVCRCCTLGWSNKSRWICFSWRWAAASLDFSLGSSGSVWQRLWRSLRSLWCSRYVPGHGPQLLKQNCLLSCYWLALALFTPLHFKWLDEGWLVLYFCSLFKSHNVTVGKLVCSQSSKAMKKQFLLDLKLFFRLWK